MANPKLFGGKGAEEYEALMDAIKACAKDQDQDFYTWIESTPKTSMVVFIVDKLHELGFKIINL